MTTEQLVLLAIAAWAGAIVAILYFMHAAQRLAERLDQQSDDPFRDLVDRPSDTTADDSHLVDIRGFLQKYHVDDHA